MTFRDTTQVRMQQPCYYYNPLIAEIKQVLVELALASGLYSYILPGPAVK